MTKKTPYKTDEQQIEIVDEESIPTSKTDINYTVVLMILLRQTNLILREIDTIEGKMKFIEHIRVLHINVKGKGDEEYFEERAKVEEKYEKKEEELSEYWSKYRRTNVIDLNYGRKALPSDAMYMYRKEKLEIDFEKAMEFYEAIMNFMHRERWTFEVDAFDDVKR